MCHLGVVPMEWRIEYYMGKGGGFPRVWAVVSLVCQSARDLSQHPKVFSNVDQPFCGWFWMQIQA